MYKSTDSGRVRNLTECLESCNRTPQLLRFLQNPFEPTHFFSLPHNLLVQRIAVKASTPKGPVCSSESAASFHSTHALGESPRTTHSLALVGSCGNAPPQKHCTCGLPSSPSSSLQFSLGFRAAAGLRLSASVCTLGFRLDRLVGRFGKAHPMDEDMSPCAELGRSYSGIQDEVGRRSRL